MRLSKNSAAKRHGGALLIFAIAMALFAGVMTTAWMRLAILDGQMPKDSLKPGAELERARLKELVRAALLEAWMIHLDAGTDFSDADISDACARAFQLAGWNASGMNGTASVSSLFGAGSGNFSAQFSVVRGWNFEKTDLRSTGATVPIPAKARRFAGLQAWTNSCALTLNFAAGTTASTEEFTVTLYQIPAESFGVSGKSVVISNAVTTTNLYSPGGLAAAMQATGTVLSSDIPENQMAGFSARGSAAMNTNQLDYSLQSALALARWATNLYMGLDALKGSVPAANQATVAVGGATPPWVTLLLYTNQAGTVFNVAKVDLSNPSLVTGGITQAALKVTPATAFIQLVDLNLANPTLFVAENPVVFCGQVNQVNPQPFKVVAPNVYFGFESQPQKVTLTGSLNGSALNISSAAGVVQTNTSIQFHPRTMVTGIAATDYLLVSVTAGVD